MTALDPRDELAEAVRLDHVVVGAELEPDDAVDLLAAGGDDDDRDARALAQPPADLEAVDVRQAQVEQDEIGLARPSSAAWPVAAALDREALALEPLDERLGDRVLVLDDQELHALMVAAARRPGIRAFPNLYRTPGKAWPPALPG